MKDQLFHRCPGCRKADVPDSILACPPCWALLSRPVQRGISRTARLPMVDLKRRVALQRAMKEWHPQS